MEGCRIKDYRVWIGVTVNNQKYTHSSIEKGVYHCFKSDDDAEKWAKRRVTKMVDCINFYSSATYAIRTMEGEYILGKKIKGKTRILKNF